MAGRRLESGVLACAATSQQSAGMSETALSCTDETLGGRAGRWAGTQTRPVPLTRPRNVTRWERWLFENRIEIAFTCNTYKPLYTKTSEDISTWLGMPKANAGCGINCVKTYPAPQKQDVFQAIISLQVEMYISSYLNPQNVTAKKKEGNFPERPPTDEELWQKARDRLIQHEEGHVETSWTRMLNFLIGNNPTILANEETKYFSRLVKANLTYAEFKSIVEDGVNLINTVELATGRKTWDDKDNDLTNDYLGRTPCWLYTPIQKR